METRKPILDSNNKLKYEFKFDINFVADLLSSPYNRKQEHLVKRWNDFLNNKWNI